MPHGRHLQTSFASGEFDPLLISREDLAFYYTSASHLENVIPLPQGNARRRNGLRSIGPQRGRVFAPGVALTVTAANGGTPAYCYDSSRESTFTTTASISTATEYVIVHFLIGDPIDVFDVWDLAFVNLPGGISEGKITLQTSADNVVWTDRASVTVGETPYDRRFALSPSRSASASVDLFARLIVDNPTGENFSSAKVTLKNVDFRVEFAYYNEATPILDGFAMCKLTASIYDEYIIVLTTRAADIYRADTGVWVSSVYIPFTNLDDIREISWASQLDTLILYHEDHHPFEIQRLDGQDSQWRSGDVEFHTIAQFHFEDSTFGGQNEIQEINFESMSLGDRFVMEYNGEITDEMYWGSTAAINIDMIKVELSFLTDVGTVTGSDNGSDDYEFEFTGSPNTKFASLIVDILSGSGTATLNRLKYGKETQEDLWSWWRGYPSCGTFYQGRHWMSGFAARPDMICGSRSGSYFDFKEDSSPLAISPLVFSPDSDEQITVEDLFSGRHLQVFTSSAELYMPTEPITPESLAIKTTSRFGSSRFTRPVEIQGGTLFLDRAGTSIREFLFVDSEQSYTAEPISLFSPHLVSKPDFMTLKHQTRDDDPAMLFIANTGRDRNSKRVPAALVVIDRAQQVTGFARITTNNRPDDLFKGFQSSQAGNVFAVVNRQLDGTNWNWIEIFDQDYMTDHGAIVANTELTEFTATASQSVFTYTQSNPALESDIRVFTRSSIDVPWDTVEAVDYTLNTGAKTVTFNATVTDGYLVTVANRQTSIDITDPCGELDGIDIWVLCDGRPIGETQSTDMLITVPDGEGFWLEAEVGLFMVPRVVLHPYRGRGGTSPTMKKQRIHTALLHFERTQNAAIGIEGGNIQEVDFSLYDESTMDPDLEEILFTGTKRIRGLSGWATEPRLEVTQTAPGPFNLVSLTYDVRF